MIRRRFDNVVQTLHLSILFMIFFISIKPALSQKAPIAKPNCNDTCGGVAIPYPFGTSENCYRGNVSFRLVCNETFDPPQLLLGNIPITEINLDGQMRVMKLISRDCYNPNGTTAVRTRSTTSLSRFLTVNNTANKFTIVGCDAYGYVSGRRLNRNFTTGCTAICDSIADLEEGSCMGSGCCQTSIPEFVSVLDIRLRSYSNYSDIRDFNDCGFAFIVEENSFKFSADNLTNFKNVSRLPMIIDWAIGNETCESAQMNLTSYACVSPNSTCYKPENGNGYRCRCPVGYQGNPYLINGCHDIDECEDEGVSKLCKHGCKNTEGGFYCPCPKGHRGDGKIGGDGCSPSNSITLKLVAG
ncbi:PREDICTED: wall-associated receptor kinase 2-like [Erythranthe guttata]|uniref:wall-associated receptor kinase 2-like n=1 Tax=Erythranthe guttata TaxID=4155 RepID=UPI00064E07E4|nr:PREDICTED: wall-associated receptor kinase 2-like [Erythranthe guttata]|eukprot:XP_012854706.1 PREDICTED: wall-associated receptor kinase 2-like [Erythranthe guttata]